MLRRELLICKFFSQFSGILCAILLSLSLSAHNQTASSLAVVFFFLFFFLTYYLEYKLFTWSHEGHILLKAHIAHVLHAWALAGLGSIHMPGMANSAYNTIGYPSAQRSSALLKHNFIMLKWLLLLNNKLIFNWT